MQNTLFNLTFPGKLSRWDFEAPSYSVGPVCEKHFEKGKKKGCFFFLLFAFLFSKSFLPLVAFLPERSPLPFAQQRLHTRVILSQQRLMYI